MSRIYIIIAGVVLVVLVALMIVFYFKGVRKGKSAVTLQGLPGELPGTPGSGNYVGASNDEIKNIANNLYADMKGINAFGHDVDPYLDAVRLNDTDLVKLYNYFNTTYQKNSANTLTEWVDNEVFIETTIEGDTSDLLLSRLRKLNLK